MDCKEVWMDPRVISLHDEAIRLQPDGASHDGSLCPICVDWSLDESGVPACFDRLDEAERQIPFGDVEYADPGYLQDGVKRYPLDTEAHIQAAMQFLESEDVADRYSSDELKQMRQRIQSAAGQVGAESQEAASDKEVQEGGRTPVSDITQETHEALLAKAVDDATKEAQAEIAELRSKVDDLTAAVETAETRASELEAANEQANSDLDQAQVQLRAVTEERDQLQEDIAQRDEQAQVTEIATARAEQVRNLGLFPEDYIKDKAEVWAKVPDEDWAERLEEWKQARGEAGGSLDAPPQEQASAMSGAGTGAPTTTQASNRRAVLGLD